MTSSGATFSEIVLIVLILIVNLSDVEGRRSARSSRYRTSGNSEGDSTEAIIAASVIFGIIALIAIFVIIRVKCCLYWSPIESIADFITDCIKCKRCSKKDPKFRFVATSAEKKPKTRQKNTRAPVKKHVGNLRLAMHTPKPVLLKRESKNLEKKISLYESNPSFYYREFMEPPPAYEYVVPASTEKSQESSSEFLQNRQRISRISRTISAMRFDQIREAKAANQSGSEQPTQPGGSTSQADPRSGKPPHSRVLVRTRSN
uniref:Uncharacterized protein LOC111110373 n=1 Tax=Crassostrea virginica TaxID=6565 RepID=A0A8B8BGR9_CRAVI|nr:uncharacterized protein LOC111110373 [Crassostrea virginica]